MITQDQAKAYKEALERISKGVQRDERGWAILASDIAKEALATEPYCDCNKLLTSDYEQTSGVCRDCQ